MVIVPFDTRVPFLSKCLSWSPLTPGPYAAHLGVCFVEMWKYLLLFYLSKELYLIVLSPRLLSHTLYEKGREPKLLLGKRALCAQNPGWAAPNPNHGSSNPLLVPSREHRPTVHVGGWATSPSAPRAGRGLPAPPAAASVGNSALKGSSYSRTGRRHGGGCRPLRSIRGHSSHQDSTPTCCRPWAPHSRVLCT